jgi:hypothetical protein
MSSARHRAAGFGRYVSFAPARPRRALPTTAPARLMKNVAVAVALCTAGGALGAGAATLRSDDTAPEAGVRLPVISIPTPAVPRGESLRAKSLGRASAIRQAAKVRPPIYLGPLGAAELTKFCRAHAGARTTAVSTDDGWACGPVAKPLSMNAVCRWWHGSEAWAGMIDDNDPDTWRCYRDPS